MLASLVLLALPLLSLARDPRSIKEQIVKHRKRYAESQAAQAQQIQKRYTTNRSQYRYLNNQTSKFLVDSLPDVAYTLPEMYSGNIAIDANDTSRTLFFVWIPAFNEPVDEVTIWLNGGPGCSSLEGFFQENGPFLWQPGTYAPTFNAYSWSNLTNMLWVEQPVGVGFSTGVSNATTEEETAAEFTRWFKQFEMTFNISNYRIFVTGESYAGRYVPYISDSMLQQNDSTFYNVSGALMYDPCIGSYVYTGNEVVAYPFAERNNNILTLNDTFMSEMAQKHQQCGYASFIDQYLQFPPPAGHQPAVSFNYTANATCDPWNDILNAALTANVCFDPYQIETYCPILWDVLGFPGNFPVNATPIYFDRADVKQAMHAPTNISWAECSPDPFVYPGVTPEPGTGDISKDPAQEVLPRVIEATNRVLVSNGNLDYIIITNGTLLAIQNMTWSGATGFQSRPTNQTYVGYPDLQYADLFNESASTQGLDATLGIVGTHHFERGLMWAETFASGHMQPQFVPRTTYLHLSWLLGRTNTLGQ